MCASTVLMNGRVIARIDGYSVRVSIARVTVVRASIGPPVTILLNGYFVDQASGQRMWASDRYRPAAR